jgi:integrase
MVSAGDDGSLSSLHKRHVLIRLQHADELLSNIENILNAAASRSPFPKYTVDISPAQSRIVLDYITRIRARMLRAVEALDIPVPGPRFGAIHSIRVALSFIRVSLEEIAPKHLRGYGPVPEVFHPEFDGLSAELQGLVGQLDGFLGRGPAEDLQHRLERLGRAGDEADLAKTLQRVIGNHGLVEFRATLSTLVDRLAGSRFEIALFGPAHDTDARYVSICYDEFIAEWEGRNMSKGYIRLLKSDKKQLQAFLDHQAIYRLDWMTTELLGRFVKSWSEEKANGKARNVPITRNRKLKRLKLFFQWCVDRKYISESPAEPLKPPKVERSAVEPLSEDEVDRFFAALKTYTQENDVCRMERINALCLVLRHTGMRIGDAVKLTRENIKGENISFRTTKTEKDVSVPVPSEVIEELAKIKTDPLFRCTQELSRDVAAYRTIINAAFVAAGIPDGHPHRFRHTFSITLLNSDVSIYDVSTLLGHASVSTTESYYSKWVRSRQERLDKIVRATWKKR